MKQIILSVFLFAAFGAKAQKIKLPFYLRGDFGLSNVKTSNGKGSSTFAGAIGVESFVKFKDLKEATLSVSPSLTYLHTGYETSGGGDVKVNYMSLALPIGVLILDDPKESIGLFFGAGPFLNFAVSGKFRTYSIDSYNTMKFGNSSKDNRTVTDAGLVMKGGLRVQKFYFGMQNNIGMSNLVPKDRISNGSYIRSRNFLFYISYRIS